MEQLFNIAGQGAGKGHGQPGQPDLSALLGEGFAGVDAGQLAKQANSLWKFLDNLAANDPDAYKVFQEQQAKASETAKKDEQDASPTEGPAPAALVEASISGPDVAPGSVAVLHLWRAKKGERFMSRCTRHPSYFGIRQACKHA